MPLQVNNRTRYALQVCVLVNGESVASAELLAIDITINESPEAPKIDPLQLMNVICANCGKRRGEHGGTNCRLGDNKGSQFKPTEPLQLKPPRWQP